MKSHTAHSLTNVTQDKSTYDISAPINVTQLSFSNSVQLILQVIQLNNEINTYVSLPEIKCTPAV